VKKQQWILTAAAIVLFCGLYFFGSTVNSKKPVISAASTSEQPVSNVSTQDILTKSKEGLNPAQLQKLTQLENSVVRGDVHNQQIHVYHQLASYWMDTLHNEEIGAYYSGEAAKLENSEKSLTFAARFFLENARKQDDEGLKKWMANESKELFEKALVLNPGNDSLKVGLGSCYIFGNIADNPMQGIMMIREVAERDPSNMYAQYMLGVGGLMSGQLDRAIDRLSVVAAKQPDNVEVKLMLAEAYERKGDKQNAVKWYESVRSHIGNPEILRELDKRIQTLKK